MYRPWALRTTRCAGPALLVVWSEPPQPPATSTATTTGTSVHWRAPAARVSVARTLRRRRGARRGHLPGGTAMAVKRILFFQGGSVLNFDMRANGVDAGGPIGFMLPGLDAPFTSGIDAAVNWGDGIAYLFNGSNYWRYDVLANRADTATPTAIVDGWPTLPASYNAGIDAAFNGGQG